MSALRPSLRVWLGVVAAVLALAAAERGARWLVARFLLPTRGAQWIWAAGAVEAGWPVAFYAVRDFDVESVAGGARLLVLGDEEYLLYLNGKRVGSNRYRLGAALDEYDVSELLVAGRNRLVAELRSRTGAGGFLAALLTADGADPLVVTDRNWRVLRHHQDGIIEGWRALAGGEPPQIWQSPPTGRWGLVTRRESRPLHVEAVASGRSLAPQATGYLPQSACDSLLMAARPELGKPQECFLLDWGAEVTGYLEIEVVAQPGRAYAMITGCTSPEAERQPPTPDLIPLPGSPAWRDSTPKRLRFVFLAGVEDILGARVQELDEGLTARLLPTAQETEGLFGLDPP